MEQFTRECLEVDKDSKGEKGQGLFVGTSMEQIYERAARLVQRTLDLEGAFVMDVSHVDVLDTVGAESSTSITFHQADPQVGTITKALCQDEYTRLQEFFAKYPEGKISESVVPVGLRPFLPSRIQYALSTYSPLPSAPCVISKCHTKLFLTCLPDECFLRYLIFF